MDTLNVTATGNGLNYLPEYVADAGGLFAARGLAVRAKACDPWTGVLDDLDSGAADLALGGLWVPAMYVGTPRQLDVVGQLNHRFPMGIVARDSSGPVRARLARRADRARPRAGGSAPYEFTAGLIREAGLDPLATRWVRDLSTAMLIELFRAGLGDAIILDLVSAMELEADGTGTIVFRHLEAGGVMPNSVYYCRTDQAAGLSDRIARFTDAIAEAMRVIVSGEAGPVIDTVIAQRWPDKDPGLLRRAADDMAKSGLWDSALIDRGASDRWMRILAEGGLVSQAPTLEELAGSSRVSVSS